jgi:sensor histidine kinase YesM
MWQRWARWVLVFGLFTLVGLATSLQMYIIAFQHGEPMTWRGVLLSQFNFWFLWALLSPFIFWLARRFPIGRRAGVRNLLVHISASVLVSLLHALIYLCFMIAFDDEYAKEIASMGGLLSDLVKLSFGLRFVSYCLILTVSHALDYYRQFQEGVLKATQLEAQLAQAQLQALKMQLHPHFLFNTLNSIAALLHKDVEAADKMIARLGDFLRLTLENSGAQEVTLKEELEFLRCYLEIERIRFQDRLTAHLEIDPQALDAQVPNLILQPIVENAIRHGIAPRSAPGRIDIRARRLNGLLQVQVKDNGPGLPAAEGLRKSSKQGLGLVNTRARLQQLYGSAHRFELANAPEGGLIVTVEIPLETGPAEPATAAEMKDMTL